MLIPRTDGVIALRVFAAGALMSPIMLFTTSTPLEYTWIPETVGVVVLVLVRLNTLFLLTVPAACPT